MSSKTVKRHIETTTLSKEMASENTMRLYNQELWPGSKVITANSTTDRGTAATRATPNPVQPAEEEKNYTQEKSKSSCYENANPSTKPTG
jgi:hypothetical protein